MLCLDVVCFPDGPVPEGFESSMKEHWRGGGTFKVWLSGRCLGHCMESCSSHGSGLDLVGLDLLP